MGEPLGGTELQRNWLIENLPEEILNQVQVICRPIELDETKRKILWVQDMPRDVPFITQAQTRKLFNKIVFVSSWQQTVFNINAGVPFSDGVVIKNAVEPIEPNDKPIDQIRLVYHPTPHRGLEILLPVFERLCKTFPRLHLDVFSNFDIYARSELNKDFEPLYEKCRTHPNIEYHGSQPNDVVRSHLAQAHIFAYPSIWRETSCMSAMEAMTAKCLVVAPNYGALAETLANFNLSYDWTEDKRIHAEIFEQKLHSAIQMICNGEAEDLLVQQKAYADRFYNKSTRINEWIAFLNKVIDGHQSGQSSYDARRSSQLLWVSTK